MDLLTLYVQYSETGHTSDATLNHSRADTAPHLAPEEDAPFGGLSTFNTVHYCTCTFTCFVPAPTLDARLFYVPWYPWMC